jgi:hypothetical protein
MAGLSKTEGRIREEFSTALKEYAAFDRTLDALSSLSFILGEIDDIALETELVNFRPKIAPAEVDSDPYTPDGLIVSKHCDFILELKTSWDERNVHQAVKYGKSAGYILPDGKQRPFQTNRCVLVGYQNPPGQPNLDALFDAWNSHGFPFPLVIFRYSLETAPGGDRMYFARVPYGRNGLCPSSGLGSALNNPRGFPVSTESYKLHRSRFHKANDQVIASYAAVIWWTKYVKHYLSEEQRSEMADRGRLSSPLVIKSEQIGAIPALAGVEVPLGPKDVQRALEFLAQAKLVSFKRRVGAFEVELKEDRYIRVPRDGPVPRAASHVDISTKILARWATHKVKTPISLAPTKAAKVMGRRKGKGDPRQGKLF